MFGVITGTGFYDVGELADRSVSMVETPYGEVALTKGQWRSCSVGFVARHGTDHSIPPHAINYRANIWALRESGAEAILATAVSGAINPTMTPGQLVLLSDVIDFTNGRESTFFDGLVDPGLGRGPGLVTHTDMTSPYDPAMRKLIRRAAVDESIDLVDGAVYCATNGPRFETPAEIRMMDVLGGDLVGMTGYPEVALAREAGVPYSSIGVVSNPAAGLSGEELSASDIFAVIGATTDRLYRLIGRTIELHATGSAP